MRVSVLGSGSAGNSVYVEAGRTRLLIDAGFSGKELTRRLQHIGIDPESVTALVVTHEHGDHTRGMGVFARRYGTPVHVSERTREACERLFRGKETIRHYEPTRPFSFDDLDVEPFLTAHDAVDPVAVAVVDRRTGSRLGVATDLGRPTAQARMALRGCHLLVLEANYDEVLLWSGPYPASVKSRIASSHGHLSNQSAARFASELAHPNLVGVILAHLSRESNTPALALETVGGALRRSGFTGHLEVASQADPTALLDVERLRERSGPAQLSLL